MGILDFFRSKNTMTPHGDAPHHHLTPQEGVHSWEPFRMGSTYRPNAGKADLPIMPHVRAIAAAFSSLDFRAVDNKTGEPLAVQPAAVHALRTPNAQMTGREFMHHLAQQVLLRPHVDILVWHDLGKGYLEPAYDRIFPANIAGFSILPDNARQYQTDGTYYLRFNIQGWDAVCLPAATINLTYQLDPDNLLDGLSAASVARTWADLDELIADYERGFFEGGAVPKGMFLIVSNTEEGFNRNKAAIDSRFRGGDNRGIVYSMVPVNQATGSPEQQKITWVPFQQANDNLDLETLSDLTDRKLAQAISVPSIVMGQDTGQTYANAQQAVKTFNDFTLAPLALRIADRITFDIEVGAGLAPGGLGWRLAPDLPEVTLSEARRTEADTLKTTAETWAMLVDRGVSAEAAAKALGLGKDWEQLEAVPVAPVESVEAEPVPAALPVSVTVQNQLPPATGEATSEGTRESFALTEQARLPISEAAAARLAEIIQKYTPLVLEQGGLNEAVIDLTDELYSELEPYIVDIRNMTSDDILALAERNADQYPEIQKAMQTVTPWDAVPTRYKRRYLDRVEKISRDLMAETQRRVQSVTLKAETEGWDRDTTEAALNQVVDDPRRAELIARNEIVNTGRIASQVSAEEMSQTLNVPLLKSWHTTSGDPCEFCKLMDGTTTKLADAYMEQDVTVELPSGAVFANTWQRMETTDAHPNCQCVQTYDIDWGAVENG